MYSSLFGFLLTLLVFSSPAACAQSATSADQEYEKGVQLLTQEQWDTAASSFKNVIKLDPRRADAENNLGVALGKLGDQQGSRAAFRRAIEIDPGYAEAHYNLALWLQQSGDIDQAVSELNAALKVRPNYEAAQFALGVLLQQLQEPDKAAELFKAVLHQDPRSAEIHNRLGLSYRQEKDFLDAIAEFQQALDLNPQYIEPYNNLGATLAQATRFEDAVRVYRSGLAVQSNNADLRLGLSRALQGKGDLDAALAELQTLLKSGGSAVAEYQAGEILRQKGQVQGAIETLEKALALNPGMEEAYKTLGLALQGDAALLNATRKSRSHVPNSAAKQSYDLGRGFMSQRDLRDAQTQFEKAIEADPGWAESHNLLGFVLGQSGNLQDGIDHLRKAVQIDPSDASAHYNLGVALWYSGRKSEAQSELRSATKLDPVFGEAYSFLGMVLERGGDLDDARQSLQRAISVNPDLLSARIDLAVVLLKKEQFDDAFEQLQLVADKPSTEEVPDLDLAINAVQQTIDQHPSAFAYDTLGRLMGKAGRDSRVVIEQFRKAIELRPVFAEAHNHLGLALIQIGGEEEAITEFREAIRLNPIYADAHANLGATLTSKNDDEAVSELERAVKLESDSVQAQYNLAMAYLPKYGVDKEIQQLQRVIALDPKFGRAYYSLGKALMQTGQVQTAIPLLRSAVELDPMSGAAHYQLGLALSRTNQSAEGKTEIDKGLKLTSDDERNRKARNLEAEARLEMEKGEDQEASESLRNLVQLVPDYAEGHLALAQTLAKLGNPQESVSEFNRTLELQPNLYAARFGLGHVLRDTGNLREAVSELRHAIQLQPSSIEAYDELGLALSQSGDKSGAAVVFREALQIEPGDQTAEQNLDVIQKQTAPARNPFDIAAHPVSPSPAAASTTELIPSGDDDLDAIKGFESAIEKDEIDAVEPRVVAYLQDHPNSWRAHYIYGYLLFRMRKFGESIRELSRSLEINTDDAEAHKILAKDFVVIGQIDYAQAELQQAVRINPNSAEIHYSLGEVYSTKDMVPEAKAEFMAAIERDPTYAEAYNALGFTEESLDNDAAALKQYTKAIEVADQKGFKYDAPYINLSAYYNRLGNPQLALQYAQKALALDSKSDLAYYQLAKAYESQKEFDKAADALGTAIVIMPNSAQYYYVLSQIDRKLGRKKESADALQNFERLQREAQLVDKKIRDNRQPSSPNSARQ